MEFTCILYTNIVLDGRYWDFNIIEALVILQAISDAALRLNQFYCLSEFGEYKVTGPKKQNKFLLSINYA